MLSVAIIGAGMAALSAAQALQGVAEVTLFEKSRGLGGRLATRYADAYQFDHGAQHFTVKTEAFQAFLQPLIAAGVIARWDARFAEMDRANITELRQWNADYPHYVGAPKMNAIGKYLAHDLDVVRACRIATLARAGKRWQLLDENSKSHGEYDWVICTAPAQQASELLPSDFAHYHRLSHTKLVGCYAVMLGFAQTLTLPFDAALVKEADISWVSVNSSKPGREANGFSLLAHATNGFAEAHMQSDAEQVKRHLLGELSEVIGLDVTTAEHQAIHRWRYANIEKQQGDAALVDTEQQLIACGDWCIHGRVESAFVSGMAAAKALKEHIA